MVGWHRLGWGLICHWVVRQECLSSWGITGEIQRKSPGSKFPASLTSLDASGCFNVTGDILLVCYFKSWILVEWGFNSGFRVENPTWHCMFVTYRILHSAVHPSVVVSSWFACFFFFQIQWVDSCRSVQNTHISFVRRL